jgi:hypothetical protein
LGDSEPERWRQLLDKPLDPRHPIRHNIWTSVLDVIQRCVFEKMESRIDSSNIFIRNAVGDSIDKPSDNQVDWNKPQTETELQYLQGIIHQYRPIMIISFGAFSFEFARRALFEPKLNYGYWTAQTLGQEFRDRINGFDIRKTNLIPLLHRSIAGGKFIQSHDYFCGSNNSNFFDYVGGQIAELLILHRYELNIWLKKP